MKKPRIMFAAPSSGSGKTLITCGILQLLVNRGFHVASFKCGPDYIDPMFHTKVIGTDSGNLDTWFGDEETVRYLFCRTARKADISVLEGVMGFYDGVAGISLQASSYDVARTVDAPVVLIVNTKGMSLSVLPLIQGFLDFKADAPVQGVILNQMTKSMYGEMKEQIESKLGVRVYGYVPKVEDCVIESRHLGLVTPGEISDLRERLQKLAGILEETLDVEGLLRLAESAQEMESVSTSVVVDARVGTPVIGVARDEAFCFYYKDNLELLEELGANLCYFSPIHDEKLPEELDGLLLGGGYPELYAQQLSENKSMLTSVRERIREGLPFLAECGGFMYLHRKMEDMNGNVWPMADVIDGEVFRTRRLGRFGYIELTANREQVFCSAGEKIRGHEFHYFDSTANGDSFHAAKPLRKRSWDCIHAGENFAAGFPHLYYYSNPDFAKRFVACCERYSLRRDGKGEEEA